MIDIPTGMKALKNKYLKYLILGLISAVVVTFRPRKKQEIVAERDYPEIAAEGILRGVTEYNAISYYVEGDSLAGFYHDIFRAFARDKALKAELVPEMSFEKRLSGLRSGEFDVIAYGIPITSEWKDSLLFTIPLAQTKQILVQRKLNEEDSIAINSQIDLAGKTLYVVKGSPAILRIHNLANEIADTIYIHQIEDYGVEQLIAMVAHGDIDFVVCEESIAQTMTDSLANIDISTGIGFTQLYAWAVSKHSPELLDTLNHWLEDFIPSAEYKALYQRYYYKK